MNLLARFDPGTLVLWGAATVLGITVLATLGVEALIGGMGRRLSAAGRHEIRLAALLVCLASPVIVVGAARFGLIWPGRLTSPSPPVGAQLGSAAIRAPARPVDSSGPIERRPATGAVGLGANEPAATGAPSVVAPRQVPQSVPRAAAAAPVGAAVAPLGFSSASLDRTRRAWAGALALIWGGGVLVLLGRLAAGLLRVVALRRRVEPLAVGVPEGVRGQVRRALGIAQLPPIEQAWGLVVPVVVGWVRPRVVLPPGLVERLSPKSLRDVLIHECAHAQRRDPVVGLLQRVAGAAFWPNPLIHWLNARLTRCREEACDAAVLRLGDPPAYARTLLILAEAAGAAARWPTRGGVALFDSTWPLGDRVAEILNHRGSTEMPTSRWWTPASALVLILLSVTATAAFGPLPSPAPLSSKATAPVRTESPPRPMPLPALVVARQDPPPPKPAPAPAPAAIPGQGRIFRLRVVAAATGQPVPNAEVHAWVKFQNADWRRTDAEGRLDIPYATGPDDQTISFDVWGDGFAMQRHVLGEYPNVPIPADLTIRLHPGESLGGLIQDEAGRPIVGAEVLLWSHNYKRQDPTELIYDLRAVSGPDGRWRTGGAPITTGELLSLRVSHPDFVSERNYESHRPQPTIADLRRGSAVSTLRKGVPIEGRVVDAAGQPVAGALVISTEQPMMLFDHRFTVRTDADGRFRTGQVAAGEWHLVVRASGHAPAARKLQVGTAIPFELIRLEAAHPITARVVDPDGQPIAGVFVNVDTWQGYRCLGVFLYSDADGRVRWPNGPADAVQINASTQGYLATSNRPVVAGTEATLTLHPSLRVSGTVRDAETRKRVERAEAEYGAVDPQTGAVSTWIAFPRPGPIAFYQGSLTAQIPIRPDVDAYQVRINAEGYVPFVSRTFRRAERAVLNYDVLLTPGRGAWPLATVVRPDGRPLAGARITRDQPDRSIHLRDDSESGTPSGLSPLVTADDGTFIIRTSPRSALVVIRGDDCFAYSHSKALLASPRLVARPYARVEGRFLVGTRPLANASIQLLGKIRDESTASVYLEFDRRATTDAEGRFTFERVIPLDNLRISRVDQRVAGPNHIWSAGEAVQVTDGATVNLTVGGRGRPVVGRVEAPAGWDRAIDLTGHYEIRLESDEPDTPYPPELFRGKTSLDGIDWGGWGRAWRQSDAGRAWQAALVRTRVGLAPDGSFRVDDVPAGRYRVVVQAISQGGSEEPFAATARVAVVPPMAEGRSDEPLDLGTIRLRTRTALADGAPCPPFAVTTTDGRTLKVPDDFAGQFLLLDFGSPTEDQSLFQITRLNAVAELVGKDKRLALLSLVLADDRPDVRAYVAAKGQPWPQAIVGAPDNAISTIWGIEPDFNGPVAVLIGPDGRIVAHDLRYNAIAQAVAQALGLPAPDPQR